MSDRMRSNMEPIITSDGKFLCEADKRTFNTREDFDRHCSEAHRSANTSANERGW